MSADERWDSVRRLRSERPRSRLLRVSCVALALLTAYAWLSPELSALDLFAARRWENVGRFLRVDALPAPLRSGGGGWSALPAWLADLMRSRGAEALVVTVASSILAITLAGALGFGLAILSSRALLARDPYGVKLEGSAVRGALHPTTMLRHLTQVVSVFLRAIPEYVWAFLLLATLGGSALALVVALALHNAGILGRLGAEVFDDAERAPLRSLRAIGAGRSQVIAAGLMPLAFPRLLVYLFYRFETCIRESTVLGLLGVVSLGYWIEDARSRQRYDELLFFVALGAGLVLAADLASRVTRRWVR